MKTNETALIQTTLENYISAYLNADSELLLQAFSKETRLYSSENGVLEKLEMKDWLSNLKSRKEKGDIRKGESKVISIDITDQAASVKMTLALQNLQFTDYLSLLKIESGWKIVGKIYSAQKVE